MSEERLLRIGEVRHVTGLSKSEIYRRVKAQVFPRPRRLSHRVSVWLKSELDNWMTTQFN
ncbi:helix-turn-helix transcriptional regulator [Plastorhodobacter daqingensis]|uniref:Helix-turn-helix transcriptional regulator n=1 Tax=Plastorhodobacter daqingensis TaxID=1387281 RepID=A0ABW2UK17_9RHOB